MQRPELLVHLGYIWRHVSAVKRPSSGQQRIVFFWSEDGRLTAETCRQI